MVEEIVPPPVPVAQASPAMQPTAPAPQEVAQGHDDIQRAAAARVRAETTHAAWSQYHGAVAVTGPMSYPHGTEWICYCRQRVHKQFMVCVNCGYHKEGHRVEVAEVPWRCRFDGWVNAAGDGICNYRGSPNRPDRAGRLPCNHGRLHAALPTGEPFKLWDWNCSACADQHQILYANHANRISCNHCGAHRAWLEEGHQVKLRLDYPVGTTFNSDWPSAGGM